MFLLAHLYLRRSNVFVAVSLYQGHIWEQEMQPVPPSGTLPGEPGLDLASSYVPFRKALTDFLEADNA